MNERMCNVAHNSTETMKPQKHYLMRFKQQLSTIGNVKHFNY